MKLTDQHRTIINEMLSKWVGDYRDIEAFTSDCKRLLAVKSPLQKRMESGGPR